MKDGVCVAFFTLHEGDGPKDYTDNSQAIFFRSFSVDQRYRGRGIGKRTIELLPSYVKDCYPHINEITLAVNTDNKERLIYINKRVINILMIVSWLAVRSRDDTRFEIKYDNTRNPTIHDV